MFVNCDKGIRVHLVSLNSKKEHYYVFRGFCHHIKDEPVEAIVYQGNTNFTKTRWKSLVELGQFLHSLRVTKVSQRN